MRSPLGITSKAIDLPVDEEKESPTVSAEEQAREDRMERTRQRVKELLKDPEFMASLRSIDSTSSPERDEEFLRRLEEGEFRRAVNIRLYGRDFGDPSEDPDGE